MTEITLHTGIMGEQSTIDVQWHDENNVRQMTEININIQPQDKPRTLEILVNGIVQAVIPRRSP